MGGGCTCNSTIKKYFYSSADYELNPGNNSNDNSQNNKNKIPEKNIKIIPKEDDIDNIKSNNIQDSDKTKKQNDKNHTSNISNKIINNSPSINNGNKNNISNNNLNNNSSLYLCSNHNSNKNISNNNVNHNRHVVSNTVIVNGNNNNNNNSSNINYQNQTQNNLGSKHKAVQKKIEDEKVKKAETNYNYNLGEHNFIFINISQGSSVIKNESEKYESTTPKMGMEKDNFEDMGKANKRKFSHFYINQKPIKKISNNNNKLPRADHSLCYMLNYSEEMLKAINSLRKNPESFIQYIDSMVNNNIQINNDEIFLVSENVDEKIKLMDDYLLIFEQIKRSLQDIINSKIVEDLEELKYNEELEIDIEYAKNLMVNNQSHVEMSSISNSKYLSNTNNVKKKKKNNFNSTLDLSDDIIATLILNKRKELKQKYPENIFKMNIIKDININILIQISMEIMYDNNNKMLNEIIFNPKYKNFAVSWANELNRNFISISCFA